MCGTTGSQTHLQFNNTEEPLETFNHLCSLHKIVLEENQKLFWFQTDHSWSMAPLIACVFEGDVLAHFQFEITDTWNTETAHII